MFITRQHIGGRVKRIYMCGRNIRHEALGIALATCALTKQILDRKPIELNEIDAIVLTIEMKQNLVGDRMSTPGFWRVFHDTCCDSHEQKKIIWRQTDRMAPEDIEILKIRLKAMHYGWLTGTSKEQVLDFLDALNSRALHLCNHP